MNRERLMRAFTEAAGEAAVRADEPMSAHTTFRIGGPADFFLEPSGAEEIRERYCRTSLWEMAAISLSPTADTAAR